MAPTDHTWPQDAGQGVDDGDYDDAASVAQAVFDPALKNVVVKGLELENLGDGSFDLSGGVAKVYVPSMQTKDRGSGGEFRDECLITQQVEARNGIQYDGTGTTHVFLQIDLSKNNSVSIIKNGDGTAPAAPSMKLGVVDEMTDTSSLVNRRLKAEYDSAWLGQLLEPPSDEQIPAGTIAFYAKDDGNIYKKPAGGAESRVGGDVGGAFQDTDDDGAAELQDDHADFDGGDARNIGTLDAEAAEYDSAWLGQLSESPSDAEIPTGTIAFYAKDDGNVYKKPDGGAESRVGVSDGTKQRLTTHAIPVTELADGDYVDLPLYVPNGKAVGVWRWGARTASQTTPGGLRVGLYDLSAGNYVNSSSTAYEAGTPLASESGAADVALRLENSSGGTLNAGAVFSATIEDESEVM